MKKLILCVCIGVFLIPCTLLQAEDGLLVHYEFQEGSGKVLRDSSGGGHDGAIKGGTEWVKGQSFGALSFNGKDAVVEGPTNLPIKDAGTVTVWAYPREFGGGMVVWHDAYDRLGLAFDVYSTNNLIGNVSSGSFGVSVFGASQAPEYLNRWSHYVLRFDDQGPQLFRNGKLQDSGNPRYGMIPGIKDLPMRLGSHSSYGVPYYDGMIAEVKVYNRALSDSEIAAQFREKAPILKPYLPRGLKVTHAMHYARRDLVVDVDLSDLALEANVSDLSLAGGVVEAQLRSGSKVLQKKTKSVTGNEHRTKLTFPLGELPVGDYEIHCALRDATGAELVASTTRWRMPKLAAPGVKVLNNLVAELLDVRNIAAQPEQELSFTNPRKGWVFVTCSANLANDGVLNIAVEGAPEGSAIKMAVGRGPAPGETMVFLPEGPAKLRIRSQGTPIIRRLTVRAIPELMASASLNSAGNPLNRAPAYGDYNGDFLKKDVLPNLNTIIGSSQAAWAGMIGLPHWPQERVRKLMVQDSWHAMGRRRLEEQPIVYPSDVKKVVTGQEVFDHFSKLLDLKDPTLAGFMPDELILSYGFGAPEQKYPYVDFRYLLPAYTEAMRLMAAAEEYKGKDIYFYGTGLHGAVIPEAKEFVETAISLGHKFAPNTYLPEPETQQIARYVLSRHLGGQIEGANALFPGVVENIIMNLGFLSAGGENLASNAQVDIKVWMDMMVRYLATDPKCFGLGGIMWYKVSYTDEEVYRWAGRLFRHYAIEGRTDSLSAIYGYKYHPGIIQNAEFEEGLKGWTTHEAEPGAIQTEVNDEVGRSQGRYHLEHKGRTFLLTRRCAKGPNKVSQVIKNLTPGRLYSARMFASDYQDTLDGKKTGPETGARLIIEQAEMIWEKSFISEARSFRKRRFDFHRLVFRATGTTAKLTISDWTDDTTPGGPIGQKIICNFIQVQPYFD